MFMQMAKDMGLNVGLPPIVINSLKQPTKKTQSLMSERNVIFLRPYSPNGIAMTGEQILASVRADAKAGTLTYLDGEQVDSHDIENFAYYCNNVGRDPVSKRAVIDYLMR